MHPAPLVTITKQDEDLGFRILNHDNFRSTAVEQAVVKPFNQDIQKNKPNVIVRPTRRIMNISEENNKQISLSNGILNNNTNTQNQYDAFSDIVEMKKFARTLDMKLKKHQEEEKNQQKKFIYDPPYFKKPFISTVKRGLFLEPPAEIARLIGIRIEEQKCIKKNLKETKKLYAFASHPRVLSRTLPKTVYLSSLYRNQPRTPIKEKCSKSTTDDQPKWNPNFGYAKLLSKDEMDLSSNRIEQAQRRALARKRAQNQHVIHKEFATISAFASVNYLHETLITKGLLSAKHFYDAASQTEDEDVSELNICKNNVQVQVYPSDLFDFDSQVEPIVEVLVSKTIEEALIEVLEEEELLAFKEQQRKFFEYMAGKSDSNPEVNFEQDVDQDLVKKMPKGLNHYYIHNLVSSV